MPSKLTEAEVIRIAELARLDLTPAEVELFTRQLADILTYADEIQQADTTGVPPTSHPLVTETVWRDDVALGSLDRQRALANAPDAVSSAGLFRVPKVL